VYLQGGEGITTGDKAWRGRGIRTLELLATDWTWCSGKGKAFEKPTCNSEHKSASQKEARRLADDASNTGDTLASSLRMLVKQSGMTDERKAQASKEIVAVCAKLARGEQPLEGLRPPPKCGPCHGHTGQTHEFLCLARKQQPAEPEKGVRATILSKIGAAWRAQQHALQLVRDAEEGCTSPTLALATPVSELEMVECNAAPAALAAAPVAALVAAPAATTAAIAWREGTQAAQLRDRRPQVAGGAADQAVAAAPTATTVPNLAAIRAAVDAAAFHAAGVKAADEKVFYDYQSVWSRSSRWGCEVGRRRRLRLRRRRRATDVHVGEVGNRQGCEGTREPGLGEVGSREPPGM